MFKKIIVLIGLMVLIISCFSISFASEIVLSDESISINGKVLSGEIVDGIILTDTTYNGSDGEKALEENIAIKNVITITEDGEYIFSGILSDGQIAVDANKINGEVKIVLDNVNIKTENAPAIFIFSKELDNDKCKVTISTTQNSVNEISGGKIKIGVEEIKNQEDILYYIEKSYDDDGTYYERYKYDGAISSDISITFDGDGTLNINGNAKEGIESKRNITIENGTYVIKSVDDAINGCGDGKSVITINGGKVIAFLTDEAEEGDGIDSNGYLYINGGAVDAFACPGSESGLDSDLGT